MQATRLLANAKIRALIDRKCHEAEERLEITRDDILKGLLAAFQVAREQGEPVAMVAACREVGRMLGYYEPKMVVKRELSTNQTELKRRIREMSEEDLLAILAKAD